MQATFEERVDIHVRLFEITCMPPAGVYPLPGGGSTLSLIEAGVLVVLALLLTLLATVALVRSRIGE